MPDRQNLVTHLINLDNWDKFFLKKNERADNVICGALQNPANNYIFRSYGKGQLSTDFDHFDLGLPESSASINSEHHTLEKKTKEKVKYNEQTVCGVKDKEPADVTKNN
ncbi:14674_t:CDS:2 [Funneliformis geosporum]|uniref:14674_t:CDS:1 n=1 Tax=Funneliformis geosporum TaxID=1117311 RepID=A0A9W4WZ83_9GLOM|nr:14674_t:CDS:2 [Funneliformis geosporum]